MTQRVWVIDSSALIDIKKTVSPGQQWELFKKLEGMVHEGTLFFPKQVAEELGNARHVDTPEAWALGVSSKITRYYDPDERFIKRVMSEAGEVVDPDDDGDSEPADPYVLAQALQLAEAGFEVCVVTADVVDRLPLKISMVTACQRLGLQSIDLETFLRDVTG